MKNIFILTLVFLLNGCGNSEKEWSKNQYDTLTKLENKELSLKIRHDTLLQVIQLGMYKSKLDSVLNNSKNFSKSGKEFYYQFINSPGLSDFKWHIFPYCMYHNDSLANFRLLIYSFEVKEMGLLLSNVFETICEKYQNKYGAPKLISSKLKGPYYWIDGNREIKIELYEDDQIKTANLSIEYKDLTRQVLGKIFPLQMDEFQNTYTQSYWDKVKSKEQKIKMQQDL